MERLVKIGIRSGNRDFGYHVSLQIAAEYLVDGKILLSPQVEITAELPSAVEVLADYHEWQQIYRKLDLNYRLEADKGQIVNISTADLNSKCRVLANLSIDSFDRWLNTASFQPIREQLVRSIKAEDRVRFILQIDDPQLHRLPWQMSDLFTRYSSTEVVLSLPHLEPIEHLKPSTSKVKILAILGNSNGVNVEVDRQILTTLIDADVEFLVEPSRKELTARLWEQSWDILFFAGHSSSSEDNSTGEIWIDRTDSLSLEELQFGLKKAIANGLKIAIFNSCDGLGLIPALANLQIPHIIVMREPVPDCVAQDFLTGFLTLYARGNSFYRSVREAREKLQGLEDKFPCATWLPTIYQQGIDRPPTWKQLQGTPNVRKQQLKVTLFSSILITLAISTTRLMGLLQPYELAAFDLTMRARPSELTKDSHILAIEVTQSDRQIQAKSSNKSGSSLSDEHLDRLLAKLIALEPRIIGIDNYLSHSIDPKYTSIHTALESGELIAVCKTKGASKIQDATEPEKPAPPDAIKFGFGDTIVDNDNIARRHLLSMDSKSIDPGARCNSAWALSGLLAYNYLYLDRQNIELRIINDSIELGKLHTHPTLNPISHLGNFQQYLRTNMGGYQKFDLTNRGYQIPLNYRSVNNSIRSAIQSISLAEALALPPDKLSAAVKDKLILIGTTDPNYGDIITTPYGKIPGVIHQAQMTSQLINAALENRPLFWSSPFWIDSSIVLSCALIGGGLVLVLPNRWLLLSLDSAIVASLFGASVFLLATTGYWFPLIPALLGLIITSSYNMLSSTQPTQVI